MADNMADMGSRMDEHDENMQGQAAAAVGDMAGKAKEYAGRYARQAKEYAQQGYTAAAEKSRELRDTTQHYIEENPWYAIGIALGVGVLVGLVLRGSSRD